MRIKYLPVIVVGMSVALFFLAFAPLIGLLTGFGLSRGLAQLIAAFMVMIPVLFLVGLNARKKIFMFILFIMLGVLVISFLTGL